MIMAKVKALRDFRNRNLGSKSKGETFEYDLDRDPEKLKRLGLVADTTPKPKPAAGA
jgi:hypothetical protein